METDIRAPHPLTPYPPLIINAALTGMIPTKQSTPHVPVTVDEIVADAVRCYKRGASIVHLHQRDAQGNPSHCKSLAGEIISGIREQCPDYIICVTTSGRMVKEFEKRSEVLELSGALKPDMASLTLGSLNFPAQASLNDPDMVRRLAEKMRANGIKPELEIFDTGMINTACVLIKKGIIPMPCYANILLGSVYSAQATLFDLSTLVSRLPSGVTWAAAGIGLFQLNMNIAAIIMGGHVRVGIEDTIYYDSAKQTLATNEMLIERVVRIAQEAGRPIATPSMARQMLGLPSRS